MLTVLSVTFMAATRTSRITYFRMNPALSVSQINTTTLLYPFKFRLGD